MGFVVIKSNLPQLYEQLQFAKQTAKILRDFADF